MLPHEYVFPTITVPNGGEVGVALRCLRRGTIKKLRVVALDSGADLTGFSYCLYTTVAACPPGANPSAAATVNEKLYRITPLLVVAAGQDSYGSAEGYPEDGVSNLDLPYSALDGKDGTPLAATSTLQSDTIYLKVKSTAGGAGGAKTFGVNMVILDPML